jgi:hypothetical protein
MDIALPPGCDARLKRFATYLAERAPHGRLPGRQDIEPVEIPDLLPYLVLYDVVPQESGCPRYRTRLVGTRVVELLGDETTGKFLDDILPLKRGAEIIGQYDRILATKQPHYLEGRLSNRGREHILFQRVVFPLARDGAEIDMLAMIMVGFDTRVLHLAGEIPQTARRPGHGAARPR